MKIAFTSDFHIDISRENWLLVDFMVAELSKAMPDVFIICGDISSGTKEFTATLARFKSVECQKMLVTGNHDIWVDSNRRLLKGIDSTIKYKELLPKACVENDFLFMADKPVIINGVGFAGCMGWYDYSFRNRLYDDQITVDQYKKGEFVDRSGQFPRSHYWNDMKYGWWLRRPGLRMFKLKSRSVCRKDEEICHDMADTLRRQFSELDSSRVKEIVVLTHFLPFRALVIYQNKLPIDFFTAFDGCEEIEDIIEECKLVTHVLCGHSHIKRDVMIGNIRAMSNPVGYLGTEHNPILAELAVEKLTIIDL